MNKTEEKMDKRLEELNRIMKSKLDILDKRLSYLKESMCPYDPLTTKSLLLLIIGEAKLMKEIQEEIDYIYATL